jgi:hypothetical protein
MSKEFPNGWADIVDALRAVIADEERPPETDCDAYIAQCETAMENLARARRGLLEAEADSCMCIGDLLAWYGAVQSELAELVRAEAKLTDDALFHFELRKQLPGRTAQ